MCEPVTLSTLGAAALYGGGTATAASMGIAGALTVGGWSALGVSALMGMQQAKQGAEGEQDMYKYNAAVAKNNEIAAQHNRDSAELMAKDSERRGENEKTDHLRKVAAFKSDQTTRMAANGLALNEGSPLSLLEDTEFFGNLDAENIKYNRDLEAWQHRLVGANYGNQAAGYKAEADLAYAKSKAINPTGAMLTGLAGTVSDAWGTYTSMGKTFGKPKPSASFGDAATSPHSGANIVGYT